MQKKIGVFILLFLTACSSSKTKEETSLKEQLKEKQEMTISLLREKKTITLEDAIEIAKERNLSLQQKELEKEIAKLDKKIAFANFLPHISAFYTRSFWEEPLNAQVDLPFHNLPPALAPFASTFPKQIEGRLVDKTFDFYGIQGTLPIFLPSTWFLYSARKKGEDISHLSYDLTEKMLILKIIQDYYWILSLETEKTELEKSLAAAKELERKTKIALETGSILDWQYKKALTFLKQKEFALRQNERDRELAKMKLAKNLNLSPFVNFEVSKPVFTKKQLNSLEDTVYESLVQSDLLRVRRKMIEIQKDKIKISFTKFLPIIGAQGFYASQGLSFLQPAHPLFAAVLGSLSLFHGFQDVHQYQKEKIKQKSLLLKEEEEILDLMIETTNTYYKVKNSLDEKEIAEMNLEAESGKLHQKEVEREVGMIDEFAYLTSLQEYEKAKSLSLKAEYQYRVYQELLDMLVKKERFKEKGEVDE